MKKFNVKFLREFEVDVEADSIKIAEKLVESIIKQFKPGSCKLLSIYVEGYVQPEEPKEVTEAVAELSDEAKTIVLLPSGGPGTRRA